MKYLILFLLLSSSAFAGATRIIDADQLTSSDKTKVWSFPNITSTMLGAGTAQTITNKTIVGTSNTMSQLPIATQFQRDSFAGDSSTVLFTLSNTPPVTAQVSVFLDGILQTVTTDYTISGTSLTFVTAPTIGQDIKANYSKF